MIKLTPTEKLKAHDRLVALKKIKTHKLPAIELIAHYYPITKALVLSVLTLSISLPIIIKNNYYWATFLALSPLIIIFICCVINMVQFLYYKGKYKNWEIVEGKTPNHVVINAGPPGSCKTLTAGFATHARAKWSWRELQYEYWLIINKYRNSNFAPTDDEKEVIEAYEFYINNNGMPCAGANYPIYSKEYKRFFYDVNAEHLKQKERLPYRMNAVLDEAGTTTTPSDLCHDSQNENGSIDITESAKYCRQHGEFRYILCEQDFNNIYINVRRVVAENRVFTGKKVKLYPKFLDWLFNKLKMHFIKHMSMAESKYFSTFMKNFEHFLKNVGFWQIKYKVKANVQTNAGDNKVVVLQDDEPETTIYLPKAMPFRYLTRVFRTTYKCLYEKIQLKSYVSLKFDRERAMQMIKKRNIGGQKKSGKKSN